MAKQKSKFREYTEAIIIAIILALLIRTFIVQAFKIPSGSMKQTLLVGDQILVSKFLYGIKIPFTDTRFFILRQPRRSDIVVFSFPQNKEKEECRSFIQNVTSRFGNVWSNKSLLYLFKDDCRDFIKRVIGVGGDKIEIKNKVVYVNNVALVEPYTIYNSKSSGESAIKPRDNFGPVIIPRNKFLVLGDNRDNSHDGRFWGYVDMSEIKGNAFIIYWSWDSKNEWLNKVRWGRLGKLVH